MDGGGLAGSYSVWRRSSTVYYTDNGPGEHLLGPGRQPVVGLGKEGPYFIWEQDFRLIMKKELAAPVMLSPAGAYAAVAAASANQYPVVVWESRVNGVDTILARVLD